MVNLLQTSFRIDPTGTLTVTVTARNDKGGIIIGHLGGVPVDKVAEAVLDIGDMLTKRQASWSGIFQGQEGRQEVITS